VTYGLGVLRTAVDFRLHRMGFFSAAIFEDRRALRLVVPANG
jgi:hypothetical protein